MTSMGGARGVTAVAALVLLSIGLVSGFGLLPFSVVPVAPSGVPTFHMNLGVSISGFNVTAAVHITALPQTEMILSSLTINWGNTPTVYHPHNVSGHYTVSKSNTFALAGSYAISASGIAKDGSATYTATTSTLTAVVPSGGPPGCTHLCPEASSAFTVSTSGLIATLVDTSTYLNTTSATVAWQFGDGGTGTGTPAAHTYTVAGTYPVTETVTALNVTGASAMSSSTQNITVTSIPVSCQGTGQCNPAPPSFLTPTSGLFIGLGIGALVWVVAWGRPEIGLIAVGASGLTGFLLGMWAQASWVI